MTLEAFLLLLRPFFGAMGLVLALVGAVVLLLPDDWLGVLGLRTMREAGRSEFGLALVVGVAVLVAVQFFDKESVTQRALRRWRDSRARAAKRRVQLDSLHKLTPDERAYLTPYIAKNKTMQTFDTSDGIAGALLVRGIIYSGAPMFSHFTGPEYALSSWARDYLAEHPELLNGASKINPKARFKEF
jgi:hypothetical protein